MATAGIIKASYSGWSFPVVWVPKMIVAIDCVYYRKFEFHHRKLCIFTNKKSWNLNVLLYRSYFYYWLKQWLLKSRREQVLPAGMDILWTQWVVEESSREVYLDISRSQTPKRRLWSSPVCLDGAIGLFLEF